MEVHDICSICDNQEDLVKWRNVDYVCNQCYEKLNARAPYVNGKLHLDNNGAFAHIRMEIRRG
jgi:hypothetical protein